MNNTVLIWNFLNALVLDGLRTTKRALWASTPPKATRCKWAAFGWFVFFAKCHRCLYYGVATVAPFTGGDARRDAPTTATIYAQHAAFVRHGIA